MNDLTFIPVQYQEVILEYLNKVHPYVKEVYLVGDISTPGISDIDLLLVSNEFDKKNVLNYSVKNLKSKNKDLFVHEPFIISDNLFNKLKRITTFSKLIPLINRNEILYFENTDPIDKYLLINSIPILSVNFKMSFEFDKFLCNKRQTLLRLYSLCFPIRLFNRLGINIQNLATFSSQVTELRQEVSKNGYSLNTTFLISQLLKQVPRVCEDIEYFLYYYLLQNGYLVANIKKMKGFKYKNKKIIPNSIKYSFDSISPLTFSYFATMKKNFNNNYALNIKKYNEDEFFSKEAVLYMKDFFNELRDVLNFYKQSDFKGNFYIPFFKIK